MDQELPLAWQRIQNDNFDKVLIWIVAFNSTQKNSIREASLTMGGSSPESAVKLDIHDSGTYWEPTTQNCKGVNLTTPE